LITSNSKEMIAELTDGLRKMCRAITLKHGPNINYFTHSGEARLTIAGYVQEILSTLGVSGTARTPATDTLFNADDSEPVSKTVRVWFHRVVAQILYLAKRTRLECLRFHSLQRRGHGAQHRTWRDFTDWSIVSGGPRTSESC
jgi:hypothetical protein